jgi:hypothetical protein
MALRTALARLAAIAVLAHALFVPISVAGMQIALGFAIAALLGLRLTGVRVWAHSALDLPCLALSAAAVISLGLGALAGSPPVGWHEATLWRAILAAPVVFSAIEAARFGCGGGAAARLPPHATLETTGADDCRAGARPPQATTETTGIPTDCRAGACPPSQGAARERGQSVWHILSTPRSLALTALAVWAAAALVPSAIAWAQYWTGFDPLHALGLRAHPVSATVPIYPGRYAAVGFFRWYQRLAHDLLPPLCVAAAVALHGGLRSRWLRLLLGGSALAAAVAVVLTLSRAAWVTLALAAFVMAMSGARARRRWALLLVLVGCLAMLLHPGVRVRLAHLVTPDATGDRARIWGVCRAVVADRPLTGVGFGNLPRRSVPYWERLAPDYPLRAWCHDSFFSAWAEGGPLLFAALVAFWALLARAFLRWRRDGDELGRAAALGALAALAAMSVNSLAHDILYSSEAMFALGFALAVAAALASGPLTLAPRSGERAGERGSASLRTFSATTPRVVP